MRINRSFFGIRFRGFAAFLLLSLGSLAFSGIAGAEKDRFPPFYIRKVHLGDQFTPFELTDLDGKTWSNRSYMRKPVILITGSWKLRHDLRKWADFLNMNYLLKAEILWVFNPCSTMFADHRKRSEEAFGNFKTSIPVAVDSHSYIGRSLKIDYDIPTIIGIDRNNRYMFSLATPFNKAGREVLENLIKTRL